MVTTMRRGLLLLVMALVLLVGLIGWTMRMEAAPPLHHSSIHASQGQIAMAPHYICPPPPFDCR
ncbi:MAG TPA: hypothetical protein VK140_12475 [Ktedonobacteraceae bacterium]|nr:hypothetical protein [Ktedonobacteraceae bacterium]